MTRISKFFKGIAITMSSNTGRLDYADYDLEFLLGHRDHVMIVEEDLSNHCISKFS